MAKDYHNLTHIFILNRNSGNRNFVEKLRQNLELLAAKEGIRYFVFASRYEGHEMELVNRIQSIFVDEQIRIYCCGGSGTFRNIINGFSNVSEVEIAFYPCGRTNDFLKVFVDSDREKFEYIDNLIRGHVIDIDYISTNEGICLNAVSTGLDAEIAKRLRSLAHLEVISSFLPYYLSFAYGALFSKNARYEVETDNETFVDKCVEVFFGNGLYLGGKIPFANFDRCNIGDGLGFYRVIRAKGQLSGVKYLRKLMARKFEDVDQVSYMGNTRSIVIRRKDGKPFQVNQDGVVSKPMTEWKATIVKQGLHLVVPQEVSIHG